MRGSRGSRNSELLKHRPGLIEKVTDDAKCDLANSFVDRDIDFYVNLLTRCLPFKCPNLNTHCDVHMHS